MLDKKPTYKQVKLLMAIEETLNIRCEGKTRKEISDFISKNINKFNHVQAKLSDEYNYWEYD